MDVFDDNQIARLFRLKRYEQPPLGYFENFLHEFHRRQREQLLRQPIWSVCVASVRDFIFRHNVRPLAYYPAGVAAMVACIAVISIWIYQQQPDTTQLAVQSSPIPSTPTNVVKEFDIAPSGFTPAFHMQPALLPRSGDVRMLPVNSLRSDQFVPLKLEWESREDQAR
jgi:hypothetical protein